MDAKIYLNEPTRERVFNGWYLDPTGEKQLWRCIFGVKHHAEDCMDEDGNPLPFCPCEVPDTDRSKLTVLMVGGPWYGSPADGVCPMRYSTVKFFLFGEGDIISLSREWCRKPIHEYWNGQYGAMSYYADKSVSSRATHAWLNGEEIPNPLTAADVYRR